MGFARYPLFLSRLLDTLRASAQGALALSLFSQLFPGFGFCFCRSHQLAETPSDGASSDIVLRTALERPRTGLLLLSEGNVFLVEFFLFLFWSLEGLGLAACAMDEELANRVQPSSGHGC